MKNTKKILGFTLIELLVVIGIIGILAALLLPAIKTALNKANKTQAKAEVAAIVTALRSYNNEYNRNPPPTIGAANPSTDDSFGMGGKNADNYLIIQQLMSNNTRKITFLEVGNASVDTKGNFIDPWEKPYGIALDYNFDNNFTISGGSISLSGASGQSVAWSVGPDNETVSTPGTGKAADDILSWKP